MNITSDCCYQKIIVRLDDVPEPTVLPAIPMTTEGTDQKP